MYLIYLLLFVNLFKLILISTQELFPTVVNLPLIYN